ncbi:MAG: proline racemase family protein [bacterium]|nr:proline racemase family protein [bacterium]
MELNQTITIESIPGTCMDVRIVVTTQFGSHPAVIPEVSGRA